MYLAKKELCILSSLGCLSPQKRIVVVITRAVARSENPGGHIVLGGDNVPPLVEIGLTDLSKSGGAQAPPAPPACDRPVWYVDIHTY